MTNIRHFVLGATCATVAVAAFQSFAQGHDPSLNPRVSIPKVNENMHGPHMPDVMSGKAAMFVNGAHLFIYDEGMVYKLTTTDLRLVAHCNIHHMMGMPMERDIK